MAKLQIKAGTTSKLLDVFIQDSSSTTGAGLTGLVFNSSGLTAYYYREGEGSSTLITLATMTLGTWASSGFIVIDGTNMPGCYQIGIPNAAIASGAKSVLIMLKGATNMAPLVLEIELTSTDNQDATRGGMTALPNANAEASGGLYTRGSGAGQINQSANGQIDTNVARWLNTAVAAATAGIPDVNSKNINNVSASSVTTINANLGETQPVNFTGTGASALVKVDAVDIAGSAVSTTTAQIGTNVVSYSAGQAPLQSTVAGRTLDVSSTGEAGIDWSNIGSPTSTVDLTNTTSNVSTTSLNSIFTLDITSLQASAPIHSLLSVVLKLLSRFSAKTGITYRFDGTTVHMTQTPTTDSTLLPVKELGVSS